MELYSTQLKPPPHSPKVTFLLHCKVDHKPATQLSADVKPVVDKKVKAKAFPTGGPAASSNQPSNS